MKTQCCNYPIDDKRPPVMWNEFNGVVQCHNCGHVYVPKVKGELGEVALQILTARLSNPKMLHPGKAKITEEEGYRRAVSRAQRAFRDAKAFLEVLANQT